MVYYVSGFYLPNHNGTDPKTKPKSFSECCKIFSKYVYLWNNTADVKCNLVSLRKKRCRLTNAEKDF
jgi:hypothetical protein